MSTTIAGLCYHDVLGVNGEVSGMQSPGASHYKLTHRLFEAHLDALEAEGVSPVVPDAEGAIKDEHAVVLTFDDGGVSAISVVAPMLEARGWRGVFFVTTDWIGRDGFLAAADVAELRRRGHLIGSHSRTHPAQISRLSAADLKSEWTDSARVLAEVLGEPVRTASVPGGFYSDSVAKSAADAGFRMLFTSEPVAATHLVDNCIIAGRFRVVANTSERSVADLARGRASARMRQRLAWEAKKAAKRLGGSVWFRLRDRLRPS